LKSSEVKI